MKKPVLFLLFFLLSVPAALATDISGPMKIEGFDSPESVTTDGKFFFVSNLGKVLNPTAKDGDGFISRLSKDGTVLERKFLPAGDGFLDSPKGMLVVNGVLYVADVDKLVGFYLPKKKQMFKMDFAQEKTLFLNALAKKDDNTIFVSSTDTNKIFEVAITGTPSYKLLVDGVAGANGLKYDAAAKKLYVVGWGSDNKPNGQVGVVDLNGPKPEYKVISPYRGHLDGVVLAPGGKKLVFTDWIKFEKAGVLKACDIATGEVSDVAVSELVGGPADIFYDSGTGLTWIPMMMEGKLLIEKLAGF